MCIYVYIAIQTSTGVLGRCTASKSSRRPSEVSPGCGAKVKQWLGRLWV